MRRHTGSIHTIQFEPGGYFLPETTEEAHYSSATPSDRDLSAAELEYFEEHLIDEAQYMVYFKEAVSAPTVTIEERTTRFVSSIKGVLSLFPPWGGKVGWLTLPCVYVEGHDLPVGQMMHEVGLVAVLPYPILTANCVRLTDRDPSRLV